MKGFLLVALVASSISLGRCGDHPDGQSQVSREQDALGNYRFSYSVANGEGEQFRSEGKDALGRVVGSYGLKHIDGTHRVVEYVADKDGFRAEVRSNEPGIVSAEAADASIVKTDEHHHPLNVAASTDDASKETFGKRLKPQDTSRVSYVSPDGSSDQATREQRNFDDYRPLSPVAYYPGQAPSPVLQSNRPVDIPRSPRVLAQTPESDSRPSDAYYPPIDPHTALRRPGYFLNRDRDSNKDFGFRSTSRRPYAPPYGGFDDDPVPEVRRPGVAVNTHAGRALPVTPPTLPFGSGRLPSINRVPPQQRDFSLPRYPPSSGISNSGAPDFPSSGRVFPSYPNQGVPPSVLFHPPTYNNGVGSLNFVLRAVPIPNGVQAVRVDPTSGQIYERLVYPLFLKDGRPVYDRNILLHNDDVSDDDESRYGNDGGYFDMPLLGRPFRSSGDQPEGGRDQNRRPNTTRYIDEKFLSYPTAHDMAWIQHQLSMVEGFDRNLINNRMHPSSLPYRDSSHRGDEFDSDHPQHRTSNPSSRLRSLSNPQEFDYAIREDFSRNPRHSEGLSVDDSKEQPSLKEAESSSESKQVKIEKSASNIEKEGN